MPAENLSLSTTAPFVLSCREDTSSGQRRARERAGWLSGWLAGMLLLVVLALLAACASSGEQSPSPAAQSSRLKVVATTTLLGDVTRRIGGEAIELSVLLPAGVDPHTFEPTPRDLTTVAQAELLVVNGAGLEVFLERLLNNIGGDTKIVDASEGVALRQLQDEASGEKGADPHVWFDPNNVILWTQNIERALSELDSSHAATYAANGEAYRAELRQLDGWITEQVAQIPVGKRKLVTDHQTLGYFADRYGFEQIGAVIPGLSALSEPSAQELAALEEAIRYSGAAAIFVGTTVNPNLAQRVASDTGIRLVVLYTDALTAAGGEAGDYLSLMRYDVNAIVRALK